MKSRVAWVALIGLSLAASVGFSESPPGGPANLLGEAGGGRVAYSPESYGPVIRGGSRLGGAMKVVPIEPLPADAKALMAVFDAEAAAIRLKAEQEIQLRRNTVVTALQALQDAYTRDAKLDEAVAIRDLIRQLKVSHLKPLPDPGNLSEYANRIGDIIYFDVVGEAGHSIWGSEVYTYDSHLATAAVHAGVLKVGQRGVVKVTMVKSPEVHSGTTQNGVSSSNWGSYSASYTVERPIQESVPPLNAKPATPQ